MLNIFDELHREHPERSSGSPAAAKVAQAILAQASALNLIAATEKIKVFNFRNSLLTLGLGSLAAILIGVRFPIPGLILQVVFCLLLWGELKRPLLARVKAGNGENITITIPARSKEVQKVVLTTAYDTDGFLATALGLKPQFYFWMSFILGLFIPIFQLTAILLNLPSLIWGALLPLLFLLSFSVLPQSQQARPGLTGCSALLETASILTRFRPSITTVIFNFTGASSLNSGVQKLPELFKGENPTYGLALVEQNRSEIGIIRQEGYLPQPGSSLVKEILIEVAAEKSIPVKTVTTSEITPSYPLLTKKMNAISLAVPVKKTDDNLRELLIGFIRKIEH